MIIGITGVSGFIGSFLYEYLVKENNVIKINLKDKTLGSYSFKGIDVIIHLAGIAHTKIRNKKLYYDINRDLAYQTALKAKAEGVKQFIFISTSKVYGDFAINNQSFKELSECHPKDDYSKSKYEAELLIKGIEDDSFVLSIIRPPLVYGPGVKANMLGLIKFIKKMPIIPFKGINNRRSILYVGNLSALIATIIEKSLAGIFLPSDNQPLSVTEISEIIIKQIGVKKTIIYFPKILSYLIKFFAPYHYIRIFGSFELDSSQTNLILGFNNPFTTDSGIKNTIDYLYNK